MNFEKLKEEAELKSPNERLIHLFELQTSMQKFNHLKRTNIVDPYSNNINDRIQAAIYFWNATTVEYFEMKQNVGDDFPIVALTEELVDMLHFILNQLLYIGFTGKELFTLTTLFENNLKFPVEWYWSSLSEKWGELMESMPYKIWKAYPYDEIRLVHTKSQIELGNSMLSHFMGMCDKLRVNESMLYYGYINKNIENFKRQMPGGKYEN